MLKINYGVIEIASRGEPVTFTLTEGATLPTVGVTALVKASQGDLRFLGFLAVVAIDPRNKSVTFGPFMIQEGRGGW